MKKVNGSFNSVLILVLLPIAIASILIFMLVYTSDPDDIPFSGSTPDSREIDTTFVSDTVHVLNGNFERILQRCWYLELAEQRIVTSFENTARESGIIPVIAGMFSDFSLDMFMSVTVNVTAGIDASRIRIVDYTWDEETKMISWMLVSLPESEVTYSMVDYTSNPVTHFREGHVRNSMAFIMTFMIDAADSSELNARAIAIDSGILNVANSRARQEVRSLLCSLGVQQVEFTTLAETREIALESTLLKEGM